MPTQNIEVRLKHIDIPDFMYTDNRLSGLQIKLYAFINSFKGDSFYFSNTHLAQMFNVTPDGVSTAIQSLVKYEYIGVEYQVKSDGGKIRFITNLKDRHGLQSVSDTDSNTFQKRTTVRDNDNKINDNKITNTIVFSETGEKEGKILEEKKDTVVGDTRSGAKSIWAKKKPVEKKVPVYGNGDVSSCIEYLQEKLGVPVLDGTYQDNRRYCWLLMNKFAGKESYPVEREQKIKEIIDVAMKDQFWQYKVTSFEKLYNNAVQIISSTRFNKFGVTQL